eukprot:2989605-Rhodomonas_salina.3
MKAMMIHICFLNNGRAVSMNGYNVRITGDRPDYPPMDHPVSFSYNCGNTNAIASIDAVVDYGVDSAGHAVAVTLPLPGTPYTATVPVPLCHCHSASDPGCA